MLVKVLEDQVKMIILARAVSTTGKYYIFLGTHFNGKIQCYDIGSLNKVTGEIVRRHYKQKDEAYAYWQEFRTEMTSPRQGGEDEEKDKFTIYGPSNKPIN